MKRVRRIFVPVIAIVVASTMGPALAIPWPGEFGSPQGVEKLVDGTDLDLWGQGQGERDLRVGYAGDYGLELNAELGHKSFLSYRCGVWDPTLERYVPFGAGPIPAGMGCDLWVAATNTTGQTIPEGRAFLERHQPSAFSQWYRQESNREDWLPGETYYFPTSPSHETFDVPGTWSREYRIILTSWSEYQPEDPLPFDNLVFEYQVAPSRARAPESGFAQITSGEVSIGWSDSPFDGGTPVTGYEVYMIPVPEDGYNRDYPYQYVNHDSWIKVCDFSDRPELQICDVPNNNVRTIEADEYRFAIYALNAAFPDPPDGYAHYAFMTDELTVPRLTNIPPPPTPTPTPVPTPTPSPAPTPVPPEVVVVVDYVDAPNLISLVHAANYSNNLDAPVLRLYQAMFNRTPDLAGAKYWLGIRRQGYGLLQIAGFMAQGQEFAGLYRGNSDSQYLTAVYANVLGRAYDEGGFNYWLVLLVSDQLNRVEIVFYVTQNAEFINNYPFTNN